MNDCSNADVRDQLPDLLHERLSVTARAEVVAHVDGCLDCRNELELLRGVRGALVSQTPRVDIAYVVGALPKAPVRSIILPNARTTNRPRWADWRVAAAVTVLIAGGSSVAVLSRASNDSNVDSVARSVPVAGVPMSAAAAPANGSANSGALNSSSNAAAQVIASADDQDATSDAGPDGRFGGLSDTQLKALLGEIDRLEAVPVMEPEPVIIKVNNSSPALPDRL